MNEIEELYQLAVKHQQEHDCSAHVYENGEKLSAAVKEYQPKDILEIGTGIGYTAIIMAKQQPVHVTTLEKDLEHAQLAREFINLHAPELAHQIEIITEPAEQFLPTIKTQFDFIFFDGFQIHYEFLPNYRRLLKPGGILFLANNHLKSKTSEQFFEELRTSAEWKILDEFAETTVAMKK